MNKLIFRTVPILLMVILIIVGLTAFVFRLFSNGADWTLFIGNGDVFSSGRLKNALIEDRSGALLYRAGEGTRTYSEDPETRKATVHILGDREGNVAFGAQKLLRRELIGYDFVNGVSKSPEPVRLSVSAELSKAAQRALDGRSGAVLVSDYTTGEILCCVSSPSFDPDSGEIPDGAYINRATGATYPPGSVFKLVTLTAAVENLPDLDERVFTCTGSESFGSGTVACTRAHGEMKIEDALAMSCNCAFAELATELGAERLRDTAVRLGVTESFDIDGAVVTAGRYDASFTDKIELAWSGAGQHTDLVTPAAMLRLVSAIANGGTAKELTIVRGRDNGGTELMTEDVAVRIAGMMDYSVRLTYGIENFPGLELRAKSGTAEVGGGRAPHAWFVGFIRNTGHPYAFAVLVENGGWGSVTAGSVANAVLQEAIELD